MPDNMQQWAALNVAWIFVELMRHSELLDWWLTACGSVTLIAMNVIRIYKLVRYKHPESSKPKKKAKQ
jgi:hypothetical protein